jgi:hypothetical protein
MKRRHRRGHGFTVDLSKCHMCGRPAGNGAWNVGVPFAPELVQHVICSPCALVLEAVYQAIYGPAEHIVIKPASR